MQSASSWPMSVLVDLLEGQEVSSGQDDWMGLAIQKKPPLAVTDYWWKGEPERATVTTKRSLVGMAAVVDSVSTRAAREELIKARTADAMPAGLDIFVVDEEFALCCSSMRAELGIAKFSLSLV